MKKFILFAACLLSLINAYSQTYVAGHTTVNVLTATSHDSSTCSCTISPMYSVITDSTYTGDTIKVVDTLYGLLMSTSINTTGASPWTAMLSIPSNSETDFQAVGGHPGVVLLTVPFCPVSKIVHGLDTIYIVNSQPLLVSNPCTYDTVTGNVYIDNNANCIFDAGDVGLNPPNTSVWDYLSGTPGSIGYGTAPFYTNGWYKFYIQQSWMVNYTVALPTSYPFIFPTSPCYSGGYSQTLSVVPMSGVDFPLECSSNVDVQCNALTPGYVRFGRPFFMNPYVTNTGCDTVSGTMTVVLDHRVIYNAGLSMHPADTVHGDTLIWNYNSLTNLSGGAYWNSFISDIYLSCDTTVVVGDTLCFMGYANIPTGDIDPLNNSFAFCMPVVYSYDPNMKSVMPQGAGPQGIIHYPSLGDTLTYTLHFQNTGTATAYNISIIDTLNSHLNAASLRILGTSATMTPKWLAPGIVEFDFNNIYLPDSSANPAGSQGQVSFKVAVNAGLAHGTQITNTGYIYFDSNPAVVTNTTLNTIDTAVTEYTLNVRAAYGIHVFPNPAADHIMVENFADGVLSVLDLNGSVILGQESTGSTTTIDVSRLPAGVYILKAVNSTGATNTKFTKY